MPFTATVRDLCQDAADQINLVGQGQSMGGELGESILRSLNILLGQWTTKGLNCWARTFDLYALTNGTQQYEIGPTAPSPFTVTDVPTRIIGANIVLTFTTPNVYVPIVVITDDQRRLIALPNQSASQPVNVNYRYDVPNGVLWFWPKPGAGFGVQLETEKMISSFATLDDPVALPDGYYAALIYNLADRLCTPKYGREASPQIQKLAVQSLLDIQDVNNQPPPPRMCNYPGGNRWLDGRYNIDRGW